MNQTSLIGVVSRFGRKSRMADAASFNPLSLIGLALFMWGVYKCMIVADRPTANSKCAHSLAIALTNGGVAYAVSVGMPVLDVLPAETTRAVYIIVAILGGTLAAVAILFAIRGLREINSQRVPGELDPFEGRGMAIWAFVLSIFFGFSIVGFALMRLSSPTSL